ncbi:MAG: nitroreductase family protein [Desulfobulbaceae bacterium]|nr:nitroreductase family protein [Desulfobulbaceae bacterium]
MDISQAVVNRRAIKGFDPSHQLTQEEKKMLFDHAFLAPTAFNIQHWRVVDVTDRKLRAKIREQAWDQPQVTDASMLLVLCMDLNAWRKNPERYWQGVPQEALDFILPKIHEYYDGKEQVQRDECMRSCGILAMSLMLLAQEMGYDSCPMDGFDYEAVGKLINLPQDHIIGMMVAIGKKVAEPYPRTGKLPMSEVLFENGF